MDELYAPAQDLLLFWLVVVLVSLLIWVAALAWSTVGAELPWK